MVILGLAVFALAGCSVARVEQSPASSVVSPVGSVAADTTTSTTPGSPSSTKATTTTFCTDAGCDSVLTIELSEVDIVPEATYGVEICVDGDCASETITIDIPHPATGDIVRGDSGHPVGTLAGRMLMWVEGNYIEYYLPEREYGGSATVAFTLRDVEGSVLAQTTGATEVPLERSQPNGPGCPPICFTGRLTV